MQLLNFLSIEAGSSQVGWQEEMVFLPAAPELRVLVAWAY